MQYADLAPPVLTMRPTTMQLTAIAAILILAIQNSPVYGAGEAIQAEPRAIVDALDASLNENELLHQPVNLNASNLLLSNWNFETDILLANLDYGSVDFTGEDGDGEIATGLRFSLGWKSDSGFGIRTRLSARNVDGASEGLSFQRVNGIADGPINGFTYRGASSNATSNHPVEIRTATFDIELFKNISLERTDFLLGAGLRSAGFRTYVPQIIENTVGTSGISLFSEARHLLLMSEHSELAVVGSGRVSFLTGEWESRIAAAMIEVKTDMTITEGSLGLEWSRSLGRAVFFLRAQYEYQLWNSEVTSDLAFNGGALRAGLSW